MVKMSNIRENNTATVLRIVFAVLMVFTVAVFLNCLVIRSTLLNNTFWKETLLSDDLRQTVKDEINEKITSVAGRSQAVKKGIEATDDIIDYAIDEFAGILIDGNNEISSEGMDKIIDKYGGDVERITGISKEDIDNAKDEAYDKINDVLGEVSKKTGDGKRLVPELIDVEGYKKTNDLAMILSVVATVLMMLVLIIIHRNKFRPIRAFGIVTAISAVLCVVLWLILTEVFRSGDMLGDSAFAGMFVDAAVKSISKIYILFAIAFGVGIVFITIGALGAAAKSRQSRFVARP